MYFMYLNMFVFVCVMCICVFAVDLLGGDICMNTHLRHGDDRRRGDKKSVPTTGEDKSYPLMMVLYTFY